MWVNTHVCMYVRLWYEAYLDDQSGGSGGDGVGEAGHRRIVGELVELVAEEQVVEPVVDHGHGGRIDLSDIYIHRRYVESICMYVSYT